jgi:type VI protein secretion system component Hcp
MLSVFVVCAVALASPISAEAKSSKSNSSSLIKHSVTGTHYNKTSLAVKKTDGGVTGPVKPKGGTVSKIKGESQDAKHPSDIHIESAPAPKKDGGFIKLEGVKGEAKDQDHR